MDNIIENILSENSMKREKGILFYEGKMICNIFPIVTGCYPRMEPGKKEYQMATCVGDGKEVIDCTATLNAISDVEFWRNLSDNCIIFPGVSNKILIDCMRCIIQAQVYIGVPERVQINALGWYKHKEYIGYCAGSTAYPPPDKNKIEVSETIASEYQVASHNDKSAIELFGELKEMLSLGSPVAVTCWLCDIVAKLYTVFKWCNIC